MLGVSLPRRINVRWFSAAEGVFRGLDPALLCLNRLDENKHPVKLGGAYGEKPGGYKTFCSKEKFHFKHGGIIPELRIAYEHWGALNEDKSNVILLQTGASASTHAKSQPDNWNKGWWEEFIGPGSALDTNKYHVICTNILGGCYGSTGPSSINPITGTEYAMTFPLLTVEDMVDAQFLLLDNLGIGKVHATVGASLGGMQSLMSAALYPERVGRVVSISACAQPCPTSIAFHYIQRHAIMADPRWNKGAYYGHSYPQTGMQLARELGMITYRSGPEWDTRFGHKRQYPEEFPSFCPDFAIECYLDKKGGSFGDPNSLLYISKAMDLFDMGCGCPSLLSGLSRIRCPVLVLGVWSDILFPVRQQRELAEALHKSGNEYTVYYELNSLYGHDTFLLDIHNVGAAVKGHLESTLTKPVDHYFDS